MAISKELHNILMWSLGKGPKFMSSINKICLFKTLLALPLIKIFIYPPTDSSDIATHVETSEDLSGTNEIITTV